MQMHQYICVLKKIFCNLYLWLLVIVSGLLSANCYFFFAYRLAKIEEIIFALNAPSGKLSFSYISPFLYYFLTPFIFITFFYFLLFIYNKKKLIILYVASIFLASIAFSFHTYVRLDIAGFKKAYNSSSFYIQNNYVDPAKVNIVFPKKKRNLIHIYLESVEHAFISKKHGGGNEESIIPELEEIGLAGESFSGGNNTLSGAYSLSGSTWTMGAAFSTETGLPLKITIGGNDMHTQDHFFARVKALGDLLEDNGYNCVVMKDVDMTFAGSENFYRDHGNNLVVDYKYSLLNRLIPKDYFVWSGFEDFKLFEIAKKKLLELSSEGNPFCLTFYTNDTHFSDGYLCEHCPQKYLDQYSNVYACSSKQVSDFINWIKQQPFYDNTTIVIHGDHPTMNPSYSLEHGGSELPQYRKVYTSFVNSALKVRRSKAREYSTFDLFPTIVASIGAHIPGDKLGLGVNLYSDVPTLIEKASVDKVNSELQKKSFFMEWLSSVSNKVPKLSTEAPRYRNNDLSVFLSDLISDFDDNKIVILVTKDADTSALTSKNISQLKQLGIKTDLISNSKNSYAAILHDGKSIEESSEKMICKNEFIRQVDIICVSSGENGKAAMVLLNKKSFSKNEKGLNIVVYDVFLNEVVASECFDVNSSL